VSGPQRSQFGLAQPLDSCVLSTTSVRSSARTSLHASVRSFLGFISAIIPALFSFLTTADDPMTAVGHEPSLNIENSSSQS